MIIDFPDVPFDVYVDSQGKVSFKCRYCEKKETQSKSANATSIWWMEYLVAFGTEHRKCIQKPVHVKRIPGMDLDCECEVGKDHS